MFGIMSILTVPVIIAITGGSVILISKVGGKAASKNIRRMKGTSEEISCPGEDNNTDREYQ